LFKLDGFANVPHSQVIKQTGLRFTQGPNDCLAEIRNFPVFMGCVESSPASDKFADMWWLKSSERAPVVVEPILPSEYIYLSNHNDAVGGLWRSHHQFFGEYVAKQMVGNSVYEVGGAHGLASISASREREILWTIHDINPTPDPLYSGDLVEGTFTQESAQLKPGCITVVHSHTLEHVHEPATFIEDIARVLPIGGRQVISWPNMRKMLERGDLNFLNFEHTAYLPEELVVRLLQQKGFRVIDIEYFKDHSIFLTAEKITAVQDVPLNYSSSEDIALFQFYFEGLVDKVRRFNEALANHVGPRYVFGAHVFTQMLIAAGLDQSLLNGCLDNSALKSGKRLYGTELYSIQPSREILALVEDQAMVVMAIAEYADEVKQQLRSLSGGKCEIIE
jgi:hypothetical protein